MRSGERFLLAICLAVPLLAACESAPVTGSTARSPATRCAMSPDLLVTYAIERPSGDHDGMVLPVAGSVPQAQSGELKIFVGARQPAFDRTRPVLEVLGTPNRVGDVGAGAALKLVVNAQLAAVAVTVGEALALARALRIDPQIATDTLADTYVGGAIRAKRPLIDGKQIPTNFALHLAAKDLRLVTEAAENAGITLSGAKANRAAFEAAAAAGLADADYGAIIPFIRDR